MKISYADFVQIERDLGKRSFKHFARMAWHVIEPGTPMIWGWAIETICDHLQAVTEGKFNRLLINVPPGMSKSTLVGVLWPAWEWLHVPYNRVIGTAHNLNLAIRDNMKCRRLVQSDWYQERWPMTFMTDSDGKIKFENDKTGWREAMAFTSLTGSRGDRIVIDDSLSVNNANSEAHINDAEFTFREAVPSRVNNDASAIIHIAQRLNVRDTSGIIIKDFPEYVKLILPMEFEVDNRCVTPIFTDPRTYEGELLFPERFSADAVALLKRSLGTYGSAGQLQQRPTPRGGGVFKLMWWKYWTVLPNLKRRIIYGDTAQKTEEQHDYSVFECWGEDYFGNIYFIDMIRDKWEAPELLVAARAFWNKHAAKNIDPNMGILQAMKIEDKASGTGLIQTLRKGGNGSTSVPVTEIPRDRDKYSRALDVVPRIEAGQVFIPADAPFLSEYLEEISQFPNAPNDDMVDPTMDAISDMLGAFVPDFSKVL